MTDAQVSLPCSAWSLDECLPWTTQVRKRGYVTDRWFFAVPVSDYRAQVFFYRYNGFKHGFVADLTGYAIKLLL